MGLYQIEHDDEDEDDLDGDYRLIGNDKWEDGEFQKGVNEKYPGWYLVKLPNFTMKMFTEVKEWLADSNVCYGKYEPVGWSSNCAYSVGCVFESPRDAVMFKLRWV